MNILYISIFILFFFFQAPTVRYVILDLVGLPQSASHGIYYINVLEDIEMKELPKSKAKVPWVQYWY